MEMSEESHASEGAMAEDSPGLFKRFANILSSPSNKSGRQSPPSIAKSGVINDRIHDFFREMIGTLFKNKVPIIHNFAPSCAAIPFTHRGTRTSDDLASLRQAPTSTMSWS